MVRLKQAVTLICLCLLLAPSALGDKTPPTAPAGSEKFDRFQMMLINLNHAHGSAGYYLLSSARTARGINHDLDRAIAQIQQVEKAYARSRRTPDEKYFSTALAKISLAQQTSAQLDLELRDAFWELKDSIKQTLLDH
jgi:hypothetical protein